MIIILAKIIKHMMGLVRIIEGSSRRKIDVNKK
jgi:hypothetical protein